MIYKILKDADRTVSVLTSVGAYIGSKSYPTGDHVTTPDSFNLQRMLKKAKDQKTRYFIIEATSHGLDQNRLAFIPFKVAAITNVTNEHLDYHKTWQNYLISKTKLFKRVQFSILNSGDKSFNFLKQKAKGKILTYGFSKDADFNLQNFPIKLQIIGDFNRANALCAAAVCTALGIEKKIVLNSLAKYQNLSGRMQKVELGQNFNAYIDFAHTPNALEQSLKILASLKIENSKLICVFGSAGERDTSKRPLMGTIAAQLADLSIITAEDPRAESVKDICEQIAKGLLSKNKKEGKDFFIVPDREEAINLAVQIAGKNDTVAFFGKGHEKTMTFKKSEIAWDESSIVKQAILSKIKNEK